MIVPVLKDSGEISSSFGQLIVSAATIADFGAIILLTLFFSGEGGVGSTLLLLGALLVLAAVVFVTVRGAEHSMRIRSDLVRLQDTTAQIRIRAAIVLFVGCAAVAQGLGLEVILGILHRGRDHLAARSRRGHDAPGLSPEARGDGLRVLHPCLLRDERRAVRSRRARR